MLNSDVQMVQVNDPDGKRVQVMLVGLKMKLKADVKEFGSYSHSLYNLIKDPGYVFKLR